VVIQLASQIIIKSLQRYESMLEVGFNSQSMRTPGSDVLPEPIVACIRSFDVVKIGSMYAWLTVTNLNDPMVETQAVNICFDTILALIASEIRPMSSKDLGGLLDVSPVTKGSKFYDFYHLDEELVEIKRKLAEFRKFWLYHLETSSFKYWEGKLALMDNQLGYAGNELDAAFAPMGKKNSFGFILGEIGTQLTECMDLVGSRSVIHYDVYTLPKLSEITPIRQNWLFYYGGVEGPHGMSTEYKDIPFDSVEMLGYILTVFSSMVNSQIGQLKQSNYTSARLKQPPTTIKPTVGELGLLETLEGVQTIIGLVKILYQDFTFFINYLRWLEGTFPIPFSTLLWQEPNEVEETHEDEEENATESTYDEETPTEEDAIEDNSNVSTNVNKLHHWQLVLSNRISNIMGNLMNQRKTTDQ
jgi:hypothetical protein